MKIKSFKPISNNKSIVLILGTMPGNESLKKGEYYGNKKNHFWDIMFRILDEEYPKFKLVQESETYENKKELLLNNRIAVWDTLKYCDRDGNLDKDIRNEIKNDFEELFRKHKDVRTIIFNGKKAHQYFVESNKKLIKDKALEIIILNSTSSANNNNVFLILNEWNEAIKNNL